MCEYCYACKQRQDRIEKLEKLVDETGVTDRANGILVEHNQSLQTKVEELTAANNDAYSRGWVDALAEAHQWSNPTTAPKESDDG